MFFVLKKPKLWFILGFVEILLWLLLRNIEVLSHHSKFVDKINVIGFDTIILYSVLYVCFIIQND